jgi:hypothetical protein
MDKNRELIHKDVASLVFYMHGSVDFSDAYCLSLQQRKLMVKVIEEYREAQNPKKSSNIIG